MVEHYPDWIWQERPGEFSWRCVCGHEHVHVRYREPRAGVRFPQCGDSLG